MHVEDHCFTTRDCHLRSLYGAAPSETITDGTCGPALLVPGRYVLTKIPAVCRTGTVSTERRVAEVQLPANGSFKIDGLPSCFADDRAPATRFAGTIAGQRSVTQVEGDYVLELFVTSCPLQHGWNLGVEIGGRAAPFELYFVIGDPKRGTVLTALDTYLNDLLRHDRADASTRAEGQFKTALRFDSDSEQYTDQLAALQLENATNDDFLDWRDRLRPGRLPRTVNRMVRAVTAGLNRAHRLGHIGNPAAWRLETLPDDAESETAVFLSPAQRKGLIASAAPAAAAFSRGLEVSGARPKELAEAIAAEFDGIHLKQARAFG
jgi:hypothetical protein